MGDRKTQAPQNQTQLVDMACNLQQGAKVNLNAAQMAAAWRAFRNLFLLHPIEVIRLFVRK